MANRTVYGLTRSSNGWPMVDTGSCTWARIPGTNCTLQIQNGQPLAILRAFAADLNVFVEPMRDPDSACWTATNSVASSNHLSGTAFDYNWNSHPFQIANAGWSTQQLATIKELQDFYEGTVFFGNDWSSPKDAMHFQLASLANGGNINTYGNPAVGDFIARKIRADGFSAFRRGGAVTPPPQADAVDVLARATGLTAARAAEILTAVRDGLTQSQCTTVNRIAMWLAQVGHESASFVYTEEIAKNGRYAPYIGRTWIQITWDYNYRAFGKWCYQRDLLQNPDYFVDNPTALAELKWAGLGAAWYWTVARGTRINDAADARDIVTVTQLINGGQNGITDRRDRYNRALALGDELLTLTAPSETDPIEELLMSNLESWSLYATPGEPLIPATKMLQAIDAAAHRELVENAARLGDPDSLARVIRVAAGRGKYTDAAAINHAAAVLAEIERTNPAVLQEFINAQNGN